MLGLDFIAKSCTQSLLSCPLPFAWVAPVASLCERQKLLYVGIEVGAKHHTYAHNSWAVFGAPGPLAVPKANLIAEPSSQLSFCNCAMCIAVHPQETIRNILRHKHLLNWANMLEYCLVCWKEMTLGLSHQNFRILYPRGQVNSRYTQACLTSPHTPSKHMGLTSTTRGGRAGFSNCLTTPTHNTAGCSSIHHIQGTVMGRVGHKQASMLVNRIIGLFCFWQHGLPWAPAMLACQIIVCSAEGPERLRFPHIQHGDPTTAAAVQPQQALLANSCDETMARFIFEFLGCMTVRGRAFRSKNRFVESFISWCL